MVHEIVVESTERTWIKTVLDEKAPKETFLEKGEKGVFQAKSKIKVVLGNASVAKVTHNGEEVKGEKLQGTIRTFIFPNKARFPQDVPTKRINASESSESPPDTNAAPSEDSAPSISTE